MNIKLAIYGIIALIACYFTYDYCQMRQYKSLYLASKIALEIQIEHSQRVESALKKRAENLAQQNSNSAEVRRQLEEVAKNEENNTLYSADIPDDVMRILRQGRESSGSDR